MCFASYVEVIPHEGRPRRRRRRRRVEVPRQRRVRGAGSTALTRLRLPKSLRHAKPKVRQPLALDSAALAAAARIQFPGSLWKKCAESF